LIVTCAKCATQFQLDEARVPDAGIQVRCSVCKHAFFVEHPDALGEASADPDPVTRAVEEVLHAQAPELPEAIQDLEAPDAQAAQPGDEAADDEDWEWSDDGRLSQAAEAPDDRFEQSFRSARAAVDDLLGGLESGPDAGLLPTPAGELDAREGSDAVEEDRPLGHEGAPPLADEPWEVPAWSEGEAEAGADPGPAEAQAFGSPTELEIDAGEDHLEGEDGEPDPFADELSGPPGLGELGEPGSLELDDLEPEPPGSGQLAEPSGLDLEEPPGSLGEPAAVPRVAETLPVRLVSRIEPERGGAVAAALARAGNALGWSAVAILAAAALWAGVTPRTAPGAGGGARALAGLEATAIEGRFVENAIVGPLYVVRGELVNPGPEPRAPGARLVMRLLDAEGTPLDAPATSLAPPTPEARLREAHPRELRRAHEAGALELARTPLAPGARIRFEAVVESLPEAARRFDLVVADSGASPEGP
jgi:predicted Zn finger-like uncharacterized protein